MDDAVKSNDVGLVIRVLLDEAVKLVRARSPLNVFQRAIACTVLSAVRDGYDPLEMLGLPLKSGHAPTNVLRDYSITAEFLQLRAVHPEQPAKKHYGAIADGHGYGKNGPDRVRKIVRKNLEHVAEAFPPGVGTRRACPVLDGRLRRPFIRFGAMPEGHQVACISCRRCRQAVDVDPEVLSEGPARFAPPPRPQMQPLRCS
jgi:hypothetical protein